VIERRTPALRPVVARHGSLQIATENPLKIHQYVQPFKIIALG